MTVDEVEAAVRKVWQFGPLPTFRPDSGVCCGKCGGQFLIRDWKVHFRPSSPTSPFRCDVSTKCTGCSAVDTFGVVVPRDVWPDIPDGLKKRRQQVGRRRAEREGLI